MQLAIRYPSGLCAVMADAREPLRLWLKSIVRTKGVTLSEIAKATEVAQSSLTRFVNDPKYKYELSSRSIRKIEEHYDMPSPRGRTFSDTATPSFQPRTTQGNARIAHENVMAGDNGLDLAGVRRGDLCDVDAEAAPHSGDLVLAELRPGTKTREHLVRIYDAPFLMAHSTSYDLNRPILIEPGRVRIVGVVTRVTRLLRDPT